jgi:glycosidase
LGYSERAGKHYWTKWANEDWASDDPGRKVFRLPQFNWSSESFQQEVENVIRFWMETGIDGWVLDAVNWYVGCTWKVNRRYMTDVIQEYGNAFVQPEGAGAFLEDPVAWITEGNYNWFKITICSSGGIREVMSTEMRLTAAIPV